MRTSLSDVGKSSGGRRNHNEKRVSNECVMRERNLKAGGEINQRVARKRNRHQVARGLNRRKTRRRQRGTRGPGGIRETTNCFKL